MRRALPWRFAEWILEREGAMHLELLEPGWLDINRTLHDQLGSELSSALIRVVDGLWYPMPREHQGWSD